MFFDKNRKQYSRKCEVRWRGLASSMVAGESTRQTGKVGGAFCLATHLTTLLIPYPTPILLSGGIIGQLANTHASLSDVERLQELNGFCWIWVNRHVTY